MAEILLTGASGFLGQALHRGLIAAGHHVIPVSRQGREGWEAADLLDPAQRRALLARVRAPVLVHAGWYVEHGKFWTSPLNEDWRVASLDLCRRFLDAGGQRIVTFGSGAEYDPLPATPWKEERPLAPRTPYGQAKAALFADLAALRGPILWLRLFHMYGPHEAAGRFIPQVAAAIRAGRPAQVRAAGLLRDFASTPFLAGLVARLIDNPAVGAVNLGSGNPRALGQLAGIVARHLGRPDLLDLAHQPGPDDPPVIVPDLTRLWGMIGRVAERPEDGLPALLDG